MKSIIYKYPLSQIMRGPQTLHLPKFGEILEVAMQDGLPTLWIKSFEDHEMADRTFCLYGTGVWHEDAKNMNHIGTIFTGPLVWHVFEKF